MKKVLLKGNHDQCEPTQRNTLFRTNFKSKGKCGKLIIDCGINDNLVSTEMVKKLNLEMTINPNTNKVSWLQKEHQNLVN